MQSLRRVENTNLFKYQRVVYDARYGLLQRKRFTRYMYVANYAVVGAATTSKIQRAMNSGRAQHGEYNINARLLHKFGQPITKHESDEHLCNCICVMIASARVAASIFQCIDGAMARCREVY
jgi:hypothetical protein